MLENLDSGIENLLEHLVIVTDPDEEVDLDIIEQVVVCLDTLIALRDCIIKISDLSDSREKEETNLANTNQSIENLLDRLEVETSMDTNIDIDKIAKIVYCLDKLIDSIRNEIIDIFYEEDEDVEVTTLNNKEN